MECPICNNKMRLRLSVGIEAWECPNCGFSNPTNDPSKQMVDKSKLINNKTPKTSEGAKFRVGRKLLFDDTDVFIIAMVDSTRETLYNLIDINTGERWFTFALDQHRFVLALQKLENDYGFKFID